MSIQFKVGFTLDDKELSKGLAGLQKDISNAFNSKTGLTDDLKAATQQAMVLESALKKATTDKGISYTALTSELRKSGTSAAQLTATLAKGGTQFVSSLNAANNALALSNRQVLSLNSKIAEMTRVLVQSFKFTAAQTAIRAISSEVQASVRWVTELNDALNDIAVVTGKVPTEMERVTYDAITGARNLRVAAKEYAEGALIFYQQGLSDEEVTKRTEITIKAAKAANQSIEEMSSQLTAIWNTYHMVGEEQARAAAVGARLAADTAVDFADIAEAMQSSAQAASQMGVSYDSLASIIATVGDATQQSASVIGNAYKTIFSRMEQLKIEGTDGEVTLNSVSQGLKNVGIEVLDAAGNLRDLDSVIMEIGQSWDTYTKAQQVAIAENIGGTRQYGQFLALMNNFDKYLGHMKTAAAESGQTLEQQYTQALDSIESRAENAGEAWKRAFSNAIPVDALKGIYTLSEGLGNLVGGILKGVGGLPGILAAVGAALSAKIVPSVMQAAASAAEMVRNLSPKGRMKTIERDFNDLDKSLLATRGDNLKDQATAQGAPNSAQRMPRLQEEEQGLRIAQQKAEFSRQTATINETINTNLQTATGQYKLQLEYARQLLTTSQELYASSLDEASAMAQQADAREKAAIAARNDAMARAKSFTGNQRNSVAGQEAQRRSVDAFDAAEIEKMNSALSKMAATGKKSFAEMKATAETAKATIQHLGGDTTVVESVLQQLDGSEIQILNANVESARAAVKGATKGTEEYEQALSNLSDAERDLGEALKTLGDNISESARETVDDLEDIGEAANKAAEQTRKIAQNIKNQTLAEENQDKANVDANTSPQVDQKAYTNVATLAQGVTQLTMGLASAAMAAKGLFAVFTDEGSTAADKIGAVASLAMTLIPAISSIIGAVGTLKTVFSTAGVAIKIAGFEAQLGWGWIGLILAAVAALTIGIIALAKAAKDSSPEGQLEKMKKSYEEIATSAEEAKNAADDLRDSISNYDSAVEKLNSCTKGTTEWREALEEVNGAIKDIIATGDLSADQIDTLMHGSQKEISAMLESLQTAADARAAAADYAKTFAQSQVQAAQTLVNAKNGAGKILSGQEYQNTSTYDSAGYSQGSSKIGQKVLDNLDNLIGKSGQELQEELNKLGGNFQNLSDNELSQLETEIANLATETENAAASMEALTRLKVDEVLGDKYDGATKALLSSKLEDTTKDIADDVYGYLTDSGDYQGKDNFNKLMGKTDNFNKILARLNEANGTNWVQSSNAVQGTDTNRFFEMVDEMGEVHKLSAQQIADQIAAAEALKELAESADATAMEISKLSEADKEFLSNKSLEGLSKSQFEEVQGKITSDGKFDDTKATEYLEGLGLSGEALESYKKKLKIDAEIDWDSITSGLEAAGLDSAISDKLTIGSAKALTDSLNQINLGPRGAKAGKEFVQGLEDMLATVDGEDLQAGALEALSEIDWSSYDALDQADKILQGFGGDIDTTSEAWKTFAQNMRIATAATPDFSTMRSQLIEISGILSKLDFGSAISDEDYNKLVQYNDGWKDFFEMQSDGTRKFIGNSEEMKKAMQDNIRDQRKEMSDRAEIQKGFADAGWGHDENGTRVKANWATKSGSDVGTAKNLMNAGGATEKALETLGYTDEILKEIIDKAENSAEDVKAEGEAQLRQLYQAIAGFEAEQFGDMNAQFNEMLASTADNFAELLDMAGEIGEEAMTKRMQEMAAEISQNATNLQELMNGLGQMGGVSDFSTEDGATNFMYDEYAQGLMNIASQYDSCAEAAARYQNALKDLADAGENATKEQRDAVRATEEHLEAMIMAEESASKYGLELKTLKAQAKEIAAAEGLSEKQALAVAVANQRMNRGVSTLVNNWKNWKKILTSTDKTAEDYAATLADVSDAVTDLVGWYEDLALDSKFVEKNMGLIDKAAQGDVTAILQLGAAVASTEIASSSLNTSISNGLVAMGQTGELGKNAFQQWSDSALSAQENFANLQGSLSGMFDTIQSHMSELEAGASLQDVLGGPGGVEAFVSQLNAYAAATGMTASQMQDMLSSIGVTANVQSDYQEQEITVPTYTEQVTAVNYKRLVGTKTDENGNVSEGPTVTVPEYTKASVPGPPLTTTGFVEVASISMDPEGETPSAQAPQFTGKKAPSNTAKNGGTGNKGGGGGGGTFKKKNSNETSNKIEDRYSTIKNSIQQTANALEKLAAASDDAWGAQKVRNLAAQNTLLQIQTQKLKTLNSLARDHLKTDQQELQNALAKNGYQKASFSNGFVANKTQILEEVEKRRYELAKVVDDLSAQYDAGGVANEALEEQIDKAKEALDEFNSNIADVIQDALDQVDDTASEVKDALDQQIENIRQWMSNKVAMATEKMELKIGIDQLDIDLMDHLIDLWGDLSTEMGMTWDFYRKKADDSMSQATTYMANANRMSEILTNISNSKSDGHWSRDSVSFEDQTWFERTFGKEAWDEYINGNGALPAEVVEQFEESVMNARDSYYQALEDFRAMTEQWVRQFEIYIEKFDKIADKIAASQDTIDMYTNLMTALGKDQTKAGTEAMSNLAKASYDTAMTQAKVAREKMLFAREEAQSAQEMYDNFLKEHGDNIKAYSEAEVVAYQSLKEGVETTEEAAREAESSFKSSISDMAEKMTAVMEAETAKMRAAIIDDIGGVFTDWDSMVEMFFMKKDQDSWFLDELTQDYELDKLGGSIQAYLDDSNLDTSALEKYRDLLQEITDITEEGTELNQTDLEVLQKRFELLQAEDAYEEAKNQKNTMRLSRDASGNYNYVYSSDTSSNGLKQAEQKVKDLTYQIQKLQQDAAEATEEKWVQTYAKIAQLEELKNTARYQNDATYRKMIDTQIEMEMTNLQRYEDEIQKRYDNIDKRFEDSTIYWLLSEQTLEDGTKDHYDSMRELGQVYVGKVKEYGKNLEETSKETLAAFEDDVADVTKDTGILEGDFDHLEDTIKTETDKIIQENKNTAASAEELRNRATSAMDETRRNLEENTNAMITKLKEQQKAVEDLIAALKRLKEEQLAQIEVEENRNYDEYTDYASLMTAAMVNVYGNNVTEDQVRSALHQKTGYYAQWLSERNNAAIARGYDVMSEDDWVKLIVSQAAKGGTYSDTADWSYGSGNSMYSWTDVLDAQKRQQNEKTTPAPAPAPVVQEPVTMTADRIKEVYDLINRGIVGNEPERTPNLLARGYTEEEIQAGQQMINKVYGGKTVDQAASELARPIGGCFVAGTLVTMADGSLKKIEKVKIGEQVVIYDIENHEFKQEPVKTIYHKVDTTIIANLKLSDGTYLRMTLGHPIYTELGWAALVPELATDEYQVSVCLLTTGMKIYLEKGMATLEEVTLSYFEKGIDVHCLVLENYHTFIANGVVVHNVMVAASLAKYASGGYTGEWGEDGRLAVLHQKELVLNAEDTQNILDAVRNMRSIVNAQLGRASFQNFSDAIQNAKSASASQAGLTVQTPVQQGVQIDASFPNVTVAAEIEEALNSLVNQAVQYAAQK